MASRVASCCLALGNEVANVGLALVYALVEGGFILVLSACLLFKVSARFSLWSGATGAGTTLAYLFAVGPHVGSALAAQFVVLAAAAGEDKGGRDCHDDDGELHGRT
jgi:hypothetical protein